MKGLKAGKWLSWLWIVIALLWVINIFLAMAGNSIVLPYLSGLTVALTTVLALVSIGFQTEFKLGWEAITGFGIVLIALITAMASASFISMPLTAIGGAFIWTGSSSTLGGIVVALFITTLIGIIRKLEARGKGKKTY